MSVTMSELDKAIGLNDDAESILKDAEYYAAAVRELKERIDAGLITRDARTDLGGDLLAIAERLSAYAVRVLA